MRLACSGDHIMQAKELLSEEMKATADAIHDIRLRLSQMIAAGQWPTDLRFAQVSTVLIAGLDVERALILLSQDRSGG